MEDQEGGRGARLATGPAHLALPFSAGPSLPRRQRRMTRTSTAAWRSWPSEPRGGACGRGGAELGGAGCVGGARRVEGSGPGGRGAGRGGGRERGGPQQSGDLASAGSWTGGHFCTPRLPPRLEGSPASLEVTWGWSSSLVTVTGRGRLFAGRAGWAGLAWDCVGHCRCFRGGAPGTQVASGLGRPDGRAWGRDQATAATGRLSSSRRFVSASPALGGPPWCTRPRPGLADPPGLLTSRSRSPRGQREPLGGSLGKDHLGRPGQLWPGGAGPAAAGLRKLSLRQAQRRAVSWG